MIIIYTPAGGEREEYDARSLKVSEATLVQNTIGMKWAAISQGLEDEDLDAMRGIVWALQRRGNPSLRFGEFDPGVDEMVTRWSRREVTDYVENAFRIADADPEVTREAIALALEDFAQGAADPEHAEQLIAELAKDPKGELDQTPEQEAEGAPPSEDSAPSSPSPTSSAPETSGSDSSPTSSTSPPTQSMD